MISWGGTRGDWGGTGGAFAPPAYMLKKALVTSCRTYGVRKVVSESCTSNIDVEWPPGYHSDSVKSKNKYGDIHTAEIEKLVNKRRIIQKVKVRLPKFFHYLP